jgi:hypothetical protein
MPVLVTQSTLAWSSRDPRVRSSSLGGEKFSLLRRYGLSSAEEPRLSCVSSCPALSDEDDADGEGEGETDEFPCVIPPLSLFSTVTRRGSGTWEQVGDARQRIRRTAPSELS